MMNLHPTIRARAPSRLGLAGGGTDLSPYCDQFGGAVLNTTIDRFAYAFITPRDDGKVVFRAKDLGREEVLEAAPRLPQASLQLHRGVYERMVRDHNGGRAVSATITTTVDAPMGSGLGSSSALVVALVDAFRVLFGAPLGQYDVAHLAFEIERLDLGLAGGKQDQYAAAFGGTNFIGFLAKDRVIVNPLRVSDSARNEFESSLVICSSGRSRDVTVIFEQQTAGIVDQSARNSGDGSTEGGCHRTEERATRGRYSGDGANTRRFLEGEESDRSRDFDRQHRSALRCCSCQRSACRKGLRCRRRWFCDVSRASRGSPGTDGCAQYRRRYRRTGQIRRTWV